MLKRCLLLLAFPVLLFAACNGGRGETETGKQKIVLHFDTDSAGEITNESIKKVLSDLGVEINRKADRVVINSYTEKMANAQEEWELAQRRGDAAKEVMFKAAGERVYYNVGIAAKGFENPLDVANPAAPVNRRIEIEYLQ